MGPAGALIPFCKDVPPQSVDACAANLMHVLQSDAYHHITVMGKGDAPTARRTTDFANNDQFAKPPAPRGSCGVTSVYSRYGRSWFLDGL